ncbi:MAG TPA: hypothetical protein VMC80_01720 [Patescibacteria group bacterium]|nr:hypothetical protein [Patescibacteria group bacterium]
MMQLTQEQKQDYRKKGEDFMRQVFIINEGVLRRKIEESELAKMVADNMPKTPNGIGFCYNCNVQSMVPSGYLNHPGTRHRDVSQPVYTCEVCGYVDVKPISQVPVLA